MSANATVKHYNSGLARSALHSFGCFLALGWRPKVQRAIHRHDEASNAIRAIENLSSLLYHATASITPNICPALPAAHMPAAESLQVMGTTFSEFALSEGVMFYCFHLVFSFPMGRFMTRTCLAGITSSEDGGSRIKTRR